MEIDFKKRGKVDMGQGNCAAKNSQHPQGQLIMHLRSSLPTSREMVFVDSMGGLKKTMSSYTVKPQRLKSIL